MVGDGSQLRTEEVAVLLNVSKSTVINYTKAGLLVAKRTGGRHRRYDAGEVRALQEILDLPDGPERDAQLKGLIRRNRGEEEPEPPNG